MEVSENIPKESIASEKYKKSSLLKLAAKSLLSTVGVVTFSLSSYSLAKEAGKIELIDDITTNNELTEPEQEFYKELRQEARDNTNTPTVIMLAEISLGCSALILSGNLSSKK